MVSTVGVKMGAIGGTYRISDSYVQGYKERGIRMYCLKSTNASESADNSYGDSAIKDSINSISSAARELQFLTGIDKGSVYDADSEDIGTEVADELEDMASKTGVMNKLFGAMGKGVGMLKNAALSGSNVGFPQIWRDSNFSRNYNLEFKFSSPYGHPKAIFEYVYLPFLTLMTLTLPRMDSLMGYYAPYLVRIK